MSVLDFLIHGMNLVAPALFLALALVIAARAVWGVNPQGLRWWQMVAMNAALGALVLALGVVLTGHDGRMATYAVLVVAMATCQWLLAQGWRR